MPFPPGRIALTISVLTILVIGAVGGNAPSLSATPLSATTSGSPVSSGAFGGIPEAAKNPDNPAGRGHFAVTGPENSTSPAASAAYRRSRRAMAAAYALSGDPAVAGYLRWRRFNREPYVSAAHGNRYVNHYANRRGRAYGDYEASGVMPVGTVLAKDSFALGADGRLRFGPLFVMEKRAAGFSPESGDWRYSMIMPDGSIFGVTGGTGAEKVRFCVPCHVAVGDVQDHMYLPPPELRILY